MPISMTDDPQDQNQDDFNDDQGGKGNRSTVPGGGGLFSLPGTPGSCVSWSSAFAASTVLEQLIL
jgi:hypothetical protein